jgi:hypothetical protein
MNTRAGREAIRKEAAFLKDILELGRSNGTITPEEAITGNEIAALFAGMQGRKLSRHRILHLIKFLRVGGHPVAAAGRKNSIGYFWALKPEEIKRTYDNLYTSGAKTLLAAAGAVRLFPETADFFPASDISAYLSEFSVAEAFGISPVVARVEVPPEQPPPKPRNRKQKSSAPSRLWVNAAHELIENARSVLKTCDNLPPEIEALMTKSWKEINRSVNNSNLFRMYAHERQDARDYAANSGGGKHSISITLAPMDHARRMAFARLRAAEEEG